MILTIFSLTKEGIIIGLWIKWFELVNHLENACSRKTTFFWLVTVLIGFTIKTDFYGVTNIARGVGLLPGYYTCMLHFFSPTAIDLEKLQIIWTNLIVSKFSGIVRVNNRFIIVGNGIKIGKEGKNARCKMATPRF